MRDISMGQSVIIAVLAAAILSACGPAPEQPSEADPVTTTGQDAANVADASAAKTPNAQQIAAESQRANAFYERVFEEGLSRTPEFLTYLGRKDRLGEWDDLSDKHAAKELEHSQRNLQQLKTFDRAQLDPATALSFDLLEQSLENAIEDYQWRLHNYPVNQMFGRHSSVVSLLINQHKISSIDDAEAYIARLNGVSVLFEQLIDGIEARTAANIVPPKFVFPHVIRDSQNIIKGAPFDDGEPSALLADFSAKLDQLAEMESAHLSDTEKAKLLASATTALLGSVQPAYQSLIAHLTELESTANNDDGVWKWKNGDSYYNFALKRTTTTDLTADEIHNIGLAEVDRIQGEMRVIKEQVGFEGDLKAFMAFMRDDPQFYYANDAAGKARYLSEATELIDSMKLRLDELFITQPKADLKVKAVEAFREQSAGKAFYQRPSEDGARPGLYYANLYDMMAMPTYQMEALAYHEGIPGHHMQLAIQQELEQVPKFRKFGGYTAYIEGWGLYSEFLPKEIGMYSDPYSDFGRLAMELWRACRLVVDTGIHSQRWTRAKGIQYYSDNTPNALSDVVKMVERHVVMPSQATAYKIGMLKILQLRQSAKTALGEGFGIRAFHEEILKYGPLPLDLLEAKIDVWVAGQK
jgi:uncharacterized protein (DUF885 family)